MLFKSSIFYFYLFTLLYVIYENFDSCNGKVAVLNVERTKLLFYDHAYVNNLMITAKKYNRTNKLRFVTIKFELLVPADNSFIFHVYLYQLLSNAYKRSFIEFHIAACDILATENLFGAMVRESYLRMPATEHSMKKIVCPVPPGNYTLADMNLNLFHLPETFPFQEGRAYVNFTRRDHLIAHGYLDFVMKLVN